MSDPTPLEKLEAAVQEFAVSIADDAVHVVSSVVMWEQVRFEDDGREMRALRYTVPGSMTLAGSLGLIDATSEYLRRDILGERNEPDDD